MVDPRPCAAGEPSCLAVELAIGFVDRELTPAVRAEVERRIDVCPSCREIVAEAARSTDPEVSSDAEAGTKVERPGGRAAGSPDPRPVSAPAPAEPGLDLLVPGEVVGRYVVERHLGAGGMGVVTLARDPALRRAVVIKLVRPDAFGSQEDEAAFEARLQREAQAMAQLSHPNVVQIFDTGRYRDRVFLAMEYVPGQTLDGWLIEAPRSRAEILAKFAQAGAGLAAAHHAGLVHRDFKPSNVLVNPAGLVKVTDFGLARAVVSTESPASSSPASLAPRVSGIHAVLTRVDSVIGTPAYMAPEQAAGEAVDARTDQYSFALALLDGLLDQSPSRRKISALDASETIDSALAKADVPSGARDAILRALSVAPADRFATIDDLLAALAPRRRRRWPLLAGLFSIAVGVAVWFAVRPSPRPSCVAEAPRRWLGDPRAHVVNALGASAQPFAGWRAELIAEAIDHSVSTLGAGEIARCEGTVPADASSTPACLERRRASLDAAILALSASPPVTDPWSVVATLDQCDGVPDPRSTLIATRRADQMAADADEATGVAALAKLDPVAAESAFRTQAAAGVRSGDDAARGRALLHLLDVARLRGDHAAALRSAVELSAVLDHHGGAPRDRVHVDTAEAVAFTELGDVARAEAAWSSAEQAAAALDDPDGILRVRVGRARARYELHLDLEGAIRLATAATIQDGASKQAQREAQTALGDLALIAGDGPTAAEAFRRASTLAPNTGGALVEGLRMARARGLTGDVERALESLDAYGDFDMSVRAWRVAFTRMRILMAAGRLDEARVLSEKPIFLGTPREERSFQELLEFSLTGCEWSTVLHPPGSVAPSRPVSFGSSCIAALDLIGTLHPRAPMRARVSVAFSRSSSMIPESSLEEAVSILTEIAAPAAAVAESQWELARQSKRADRRALAETARAAFQAAGRTREVAEITAWLAKLDSARP